MNEHELLKLKTECGAGKLESCQRVGEYLLLTLSSARDGHRYLRFAADAGHVQSSFILGKSLIWHFDQDEAGLKYLRQAARAGCSESMYSIAIYYFSNRQKSPDFVYKFFGPEKSEQSRIWNYRKGFYHLREAISLESANALYLSGLVLKFGFCECSATLVIKDEALALAHFTEAATKGHEQARKIINGYEPNEVEIRHYIRSGTSRR